jgi:hypothetical protein
MLQVMKPCRASLRRAPSPMIWAASCLVVVFLLGITIGAVTGREIFLRVHVSGVEPSTMRSRQTHFVERLAREVNLTDIQKQNLNRILSDASLQFEAIRRQTDLRIAQVWTQGRAEIRAILTPDQRPQYDEWLRKLDAGRAR